MGIPEPILFWVVGAQSLCMAHSTRGERFVGLIDYLVKVFIKEVIGKTAARHQLLLAGALGMGDAVQTCAIPAQGQKEESNGV